MKNWIALILAVMMCLTFAACGGMETAEPALSAEESVVQEETKLPPEEEPADNTATEEPVSEEPGDDVVCCVLTVSINPEFNLYLNKNGAVLEVECLNEDARNALENADVLGMAVDAAIVVLLEEIYEYDSTVFPEEQPAIAVTVDMYENYGALSEIIFRMDEAVFGFAESHNIPIAYRRGNAPVSEEMGTVLSDSVDENGNRILVELDADGIEWTTISSEETGQMIELVRTDPDGTVTRCDMTTNTTTVTKPDGTTSQMEGVIGKG